MVYRKKRVSRIKSKRSGSKGYKRSRTKRSMTKSRRRVKRTQMKGKFKKLLFLKGGSGKSKEITLTRTHNDTPWGFTLNGKSQKKKMIKSVTHGSLAAANSDIIPGQTIITHINGTDINLLEVKDEKIKELFQGLTVKLTIINTYTNLENSSPILDLKISSIYNIKTILEFIYDIKNFHSTSLYCKIGKPIYSGWCGSGNQFSVKKLYKSIFER